MKPRTRGTVPEAIAFVAGGGTLLAIVAAEVSFLAWIWSWSAGPLGP